jgi:hypothetical protein
MRSTTKQMIVAAALLVTGAVALAWGVLEATR